MPVCVAGHDDDGLLVAREVPEARQRFAILIDVQDGVGEQALLLVGLRNRHLVQVDPVGLRIAGSSSPKNMSSDRTGSIRSRFCPAHAGLPCRVNTTDRARS